MSNIIISPENSDEEAIITTKRKPTLSTKVTDKNNVTDDFFVRGQKRKADANADETIDVDDTDTGKPAGKKKAKKKKTKKGAATKDKDVDNGTVNSDPGPAASTILPNPDETNVYGFLKDLDTITDIPTGSDENKLVASADVKAFFDNPRTVSDGKKSKTLHECKLCRKAKANKYVFVSDLSTSRRHLQNHEPQYQKWVKENDFVSMLPKDTAARKAETKRLTQGTLDDHVEELPAKEISYTSEDFKDAAIEWLIATDQPIQAFEHPKFKRMIHVASQTKGGVKIPGKKATRKEIIALFYRHLAELKQRMNGPKVKGEVSFTDDCWQADNLDSYFAVTMHWIEETGMNQWELKSDIIGFARLNAGHSGQRLGQAFFKILQRVGVVHKAGHVTCDNASNNDTKMEEFARLITGATGKKYDPKKRRIRCLAHVINLATQALLKTYSKASHYDAKKPEAHIPLDRDEVGLIRAISVKVRTSSKRKDIFLKIQSTISESILDNSEPASVAESNTGTVLPGMMSDTTVISVVTPASERSKMLLLDMPVRWSSTYVMLKRAVRLQPPVDQFVQEIIWIEKNREKQDKLKILRLTNPEWTRADLFCKLLSCADHAQQAFSSDKFSTLHLAIPALESLHAVWSKCLEDESYSFFRAALAAALDTIKEYYECTADSDAYLIAMLLDPSEKLSYIQETWDEDLYDQAVASAKAVFKERYFTMYPEGSSAPQKTSRKSKKLRHLLDLGTKSATSSSLDFSTAPVTAEKVESWEEAFNNYMNHEEDIPEDMSIIEWWGLNAVRYPVWASLALDYLPIMASSVSSERAFSSAGITITKRRNRLKGDIVEALQVLKCAIRNHLLVRTPPPTSLIEEELLAAEENEEQLLDSINPVQGGKGGITIELDLDSDAEED